MIVCLFYACAKPHSRWEAAAPSLLWVNQNYKIYRNWLVSVRAAFFSLLSFRGQAKIFGKSCSRVYSLSFAVLVGACVSLLLIKNKKKQNKNLSVSRLINPVISLSWALNKPQAMHFKMPKFQIDSPNWKDARLDYRKYVNFF